MPLLIVLLQQHAIVEHLARLCTGTDLGNTYVELDGHSQQPASSLAG